MKISGYLFLLLLFSLKGFSQFDTPKKTVRIAPVKNTSGAVAPTSSRVIQYPSIFDKKDKLTENVSLLPKKAQEHNTMEKEDFKSSSIEYKSTIDKVSSQFKPEYVAQNYGRYRSKTKRIKILCRDFGSIDGDMVRILLDDNQVFTCTLGGDNTVFYLDLTSNLNVIDFEALNEGMESPNTAEFSILDENDNVIYSGKWDLNQGYRGRIYIDK